MPLALLLPQPTKLTAAPKPTFSPVAAGQVQRLLETLLSLHPDAPGISRRVPSTFLCQQELSVQPKELCRTGTLTMLLDERLGLRDDGEP
jgi:hypothetical protein